MTEQIAMFCLKAESERYPEICNECPVYGEVGCDHCFDDAMDVAIKALEEVQQYRAIGTPDECRAAVEKQKAMKVTNIHVDEYYCPACGSENTTSNAHTVGDHYCPNCGQRLE